MPVETLADLLALCGRYRDRDVIIVGVDEWEVLAALVVPAQVVAADATHPAAFWYRDKKIVTPAYVIAAGWVAAD